ncbi:sodium:solute symporter family protein, partial [Streptomyces sp. RKCA744]
MHCLAAGLRLPTNALDYTILVLYFAVVLGVGFAARASVKTSLDFFLSGRSLPAWVTGLAFVAANLGALEILGMAANGAQYGVYTVHWYWVGAIPAMVFLGLVMMPFYYGSKVRSVPEFLLHRYGPASHVLSSVIFSIASVLIAGVNLYAMAIVVEALLGWPQWVAIVVAGLFVLVYITLGGLSSAIYNEVLQFFVILAALIPLTVVGLRRVGGFGGLKDSLVASHGDNFVSAWGGTGIGSANPLGANWLTIVLGLGFCLSFGYWTTNFAEVQRALSARNLSAAQRTPLIAAFPKMFIPLIVVVPGLIALVLDPKIGSTKSGLQYNDAIPLLMSELLPNGVLGLAVTGLLAAFMAGMAANVSAFNTVFTNDIWRAYLSRGRPDGYYLLTGRVVTAVGVLAGMGTAFIASSFSNIMNYLQTLFSFFNVPLFCVFIIGMFWRRATAPA